MLRYGLKHGLVIMALQKSKGKASKPGFGSVASKPTSGDAASTRKAKPSSSDDKAGSGAPYSAYMMSSAGMYTPEMLARLRGNAIHLKGQSRYVAVFVRALPTAR